MIVKVRKEIMPEWLGPALNTGALATIVAFVLWSIVRVASSMVRGTAFIAPKVTKFFEEQSELIETLKNSTIRITDFMERQTDMTSTIVERLTSHEQMLERLEENTYTIARHTNVPLPPPTNRNSRILTPAVSVDNEGNVTPVVLATSDDTLSESPTAILPPHQP